MRVNNYLDFYITWANLFNLIQSKCLYFDYSLIFLNRHLDAFLTLYVLDLFVAAIFICLLQMKIILLNLPHFVVHKIHIQYFRTQKHAVFHARHAIF